MKIINPKISKNLTNIELNKDNCKEDLVDLLVIDQEIDFLIEDICFNGCKFINVDFSKYPLRNINLIDCIFEKCNLSNSDFANKGVIRCKFDNCNLVGSDFILSSFHDVSIFNSKCNYINFSDSKIKHFKLENSIMKEGRFVSVVFDDIYFDNVDFSNCEFLNTKLKDIDFSSCNILNIGVNDTDIKGIIINEEQAIMLIQLFGIIIKY